MNCNYVPNMRLVIAFAAILLTACSNNEGKNLTANGQEQWLLAEATEFVGSHPTPRQVQYTELDGTPRIIDAIPGQVIVFFDPPPNLEEGRKLIRENGGRIVARIPKAGCYLVETGEGKESTFIERIRTASSNVLDAAPNAVLSSAQVTLIDQFNGQDTHGDKVRQALEANGGTTEQTRNGGDASKPIASIYLNEFYREVAQHNFGETILINLSVGGLTIDEETAFLRRIASAVYLLPEERKENLIIAVGAGNTKLNIKPALDAVRKDPRMQTALRDHILVVTTTQKNLQGEEFANWVDDPLGDYDVVTIDNPEAQNGTSFASPAAIGRIDELIRKTRIPAKQALNGVKEIANGTRNMQAPGIESRLPTKAEARVDEACKAIKWAIETNHEKQFNVNEGVDKGLALVAARGDAIVYGISFLTVGGGTSAKVTPDIAGVSVHCTVSGTDGYYWSGVLRTTDKGTVSFGIPRAEPGVVDTITVTAVNSQVSKQTQFTW
jgi:hypothetical protein